MLERTHPHRFGRQYVQSNIEDQLTVIVDEMIAAVAKEIGDQPTRDRLASRLRASARHTARSLRQPGHRPQQPDAKEPAAKEHDPYAELIAQMDKDWNERMAARRNDSQNSSNSGAKTK